jgi:hypothetical protein
VVGGKFIAIRANTEKKNRSLNLMMHLNLLQNQEQTKPKTRRQREIIKNLAEINELETKPYKESMKQKVDL